MRATDQERAKWRVTKVDAAIRELDEKRRALLFERVAAIAEARTTGVPMKDLAVLFDVSPERVRQMMTPPKEKTERARQMEAGK